MFSNFKITKTELRFISILSIIFALRMSGIFMLLPVLPMYAISLNKSHEYLVGISIGIYGIMQIIFQLPFGLLSDKIGRKPVIIFGLIISGLGSEIAALSNNIWGLIIGRILQGSAAIGSVLIILLLESVQEKNRTQSMAIIGIIFGITFIGSIIIGPFIAKKSGLQGLFQIITIMTILTIILVYFLIPNTPSNLTKIQNNTYYITDILNIIKLITTHPNLLKININIFFLHTILILNFIIWPNIITNLGFTYDTHYKFYTIIILISVLTVIPCIFSSRIKENKIDILSISINILFISELIMLIAIKNIYIFLIGMQLFFIVFNLMESILPDLISKKAPEKYKGTAISIYSVGQFLGVGIGGMAGGFLLEIKGPESVLLLSLILATLNILVNNKHYLQ